MLRAVRAVQPLLRRATAGQPLRRLSAQPKQPRGPVTWGGLLAMTAAGGLVLAYYYNEKDRRQHTVSRQVKTVGKPALGGSWSLVDMHGRPTTDADFHGQYILLYFGFTHCPDICPSELVKVGRIVDDLAAKKMTVKPVFISVDPARDSLKQLKHYAKDFHPEIVFLTGTPDQVAKACRQYRVYFSKADINENDDEDYLVDHSIVLYLNGPDGQFIDFFTQSMKVEDIVAKIGNYVKAGVGQPQAAAQAQAQQA